MSLLERTFNRITLGKGDIDLPNDLLNVFEEGEYEIPELERISGSRPEIRVRTADHGSTATVVGGVVRCWNFPVLIITSNGEREFPPAFLRCSLQLATLPNDERPPAGTGGRSPCARLVQSVPRVFSHSPHLCGLASQCLITVARFGPKTCTFGFPQTTLSRRNGLFERSRA